MPKLERECIDCWYCVSEPDPACPNTVVRPLTAIETSRMTLERFIGVGRWYEPTSLHTYGDLSPPVCRGRSVENESTFSKDS